MESEPQSSHAMDTALRFAVPMWLMELEKMDIDYLQRRSSVCAHQVSEKGDVLMYGSKKKGAAGEVFNRLAEGIACLCLITKHPVPFGKIVFFYNKPARVFESEQEASEYVWPKVSNVQQEDNGTSKPEKVPRVRSRARKTPNGKSDAGAGSNG